MLDQIDTYLASSSSIVNTASIAVLPKALIILGGMVVIAVSVFLIGWGLKKLLGGLSPEKTYRDMYGTEFFSSAEAFASDQAILENEYGHATDSIHMWEKGGRLN